MTQQQNPPGKKLTKLLVVVKKSSYQQALDSKDTRTLELIEKGDETVAFYKPAHMEQEETVAQVRQLLQERVIEYQIVSRGELKGDPAGVDAVISIGGDGTFLDISHSLKNVPLLGINPTSTSFGHYCLANRANAGQILDEISSGQRQPLNILRLSAIVNGVAVAEPVLNEISFGHVNWRSTSRYLVTVGGKHEEHKSSGMFIGPASGTTGWLHSAGAPVLPVSARQFVYKTILPWQPPGVRYELSAGVLNAGQEIVIQSKMPACDIGIDGDRIVYPLSRGDKLVVKAGDCDLLAYMNADVNDAFMSREAMPPRH